LGSLSRLGLQANKGDLTASGSYDDKLYKPDMGRLHHLGNTPDGRYMQYSGWLSKPLNNAGGDFIWLQVALKETVLVHGIAITGSGNSAHYAALQYFIDYVYNSKRVNYNEQE
uniref:F5/8 type C domain-containing protein n=1 Tax=Clytia hemisphaerica TaxID=252671 RepID=A0A7M5XMY2_9CNID